MPSATYDTTAADVAREIPSRTRSGGGATGSFTASTTPTDSGVVAYIQDSADDIARKVGTQIPTNLQPLAKDVIALGAALEIELGADDFNEARYDRLKKRYDERLTDLQTAIADLSNDGDPSVIAGGASPIGSFPPSCPLVWD